MNFLKYTLAFIILVLISSINAEAQIHTYVIDTFRIEYKELETYRSVALETEGAHIWDLEFEFPFEFPYYDSIYTSINCDAAGVCYFDTSYDYDMFLFAFNYELDNVWDPNNIPSDVRYAIVEDGGMQALVLQYTKVRLSGDPSAELYDTYLNFQLWFFENGYIEIHFGEMNLDQSEWYVPGEGFYQHFSNADPILMGPAVGVQHPAIIEDQTHLNGEWNNYTIVNRVGYLTTLPPVGFVIRFRKETTAASDQPLSQLQVYPNPATDQVTVTANEPISEITFINLNGDRVFKSIMTESIDISPLSKGMYILEVIIDDKPYYRKLIKH